jgi:hypothetical protein
MIAPMVPETAPHSLQSPLGQCATRAMRHSGNAPAHHRDVAVQQPHVRGAGQDPMVVEAVEPWDRALLTEERRYATLIR